MSVIHVLERLASLSMEQVAGFASSLLSDISAKWERDLFMSTTFDHWEILDTITK